MPHLLFIAIVPDQLFMLADGYPYLGARLLQASAHVNAASLCLLPVALHFGISIHIQAHNGREVDRQGAVHWELSDDVYDANHRQHNATGKEEASALPLIICSW